MKKQKARGSSKSRSWREIRQTASRKVVTAHARRKLVKGMLRGGLAFLAMIAAAGGTYWGVGYWQSGAWHSSVERVNTALPSQPLREIVFLTDGVLSQSWVESRLGLPPDVEMMSIDIHRKKLLLEEHRQVKSAVIRRLPDRLVIEIQERTPVVRLAARDEDRRVILYLVDRDGHVYEGHGYDPYELSALPFLAGLHLRREGDGFRRLEGIDRVDDLLRTARGEMPHLYRAWKVVDCGDFPLIKVRSDDFNEIVFGPNRHAEQLRMLDMIVASNRRQLMGMQDRVDLSLGNQVVVR